MTPTDALPDAVVPMRSSKPPPTSLLPDLSFFSATTTSSIPPPKPQPLSLMADNCSSLKQLHQVHAQMVVSARIRDNFAASRLISFAAVSPSGDLDYALKLFHDIPEPNCFMWNTIIRALADGPNPVDGVLHYIRMRRLGVVPGKHTFPFVLKACCANFAMAPFCDQIHVHVFRYGLDSDAYVANGLMRCRVCCGRLSDARRVFDEMPVRSVLHWTTVLNGYVQNLRPRDALKVFDEMIVEGVEPDCATLSSVLSACARAGGLDRGEQVHEYIVRKGIGLSVILGTALVDMYAKNGAISRARELFWQMPDRNFATYNAMICGLAAHGHADEAIKLFGVMVKEGLVPNDTTFVGVLSACCHAGMLVLGRAIFNSMSRSYGLEPKIEHYGCMVDLLGRVGMVEEAEELVKNMKWKADVVILGALLGACRSHGNIEIAERVVGEILKLEPENHGVYVVLSNMYAEVGRWDEVVRLRTTMKTGRLQKLPGLSLVNENG